MARRLIVLTLTVASMDGLARLGRVAGGTSLPVGPPETAEPRRPLIPLAQRAGRVGVSLAPPSLTTFHLSSRTDARRIRRA